MIKSIKRMGTKSKQTASHCPWQNPIAERFIGSIRRDLLDHFVIVGQDHLAKLLSKYIRYYHADRTHLGVDKDCPEPRTVTPRPSADAELVALPRVGGIHHRYEWRVSA